MKKGMTARIGYYILGMLILALGLTLNAKTGLGTSAIMSIPYTLSIVTGVTLGDVTFVMYILFVAVQLVLRPKKEWLQTVMQLPTSLVFTRVMNVYDLLLDFSFDALFINLLILLMAIICTGVGAAMTLMMRIVPNPGDGIVQAIADRTGTTLGLMKNGFDLSCVVISMIIGYLMKGQALLGVGVGTAVSVLLIGRVIAVFSRFFGKRITAQAGL